MHAFPFIRLSRIWSTLPFKLEDCYYGRSHFVLWWILEITTVKSRVYKRIYGELCSNYYEIDDSIWFWKLWDAKFAVGFHDRNFVICDSLLFWLAHMLYMFCHTLLAPIKISLHLADGVQHQRAPNNTCTNPHMLQGIFPIVLGSSSRWIRTLVDISPERLVLLIRWQHSRDPPK